MSAIETFQFGGYTVRPANPFDRSLAEKWTKADPDHKHIDPDFWIEQRFGHDAYLMFKGDEPLLFFKLMLFEFPAVDLNQQPIRWVELFIQFPPKLEEPAQRRLQALELMNGMRQGFQWIERVLVEVPIQCVFCESRSESLIAFCVRHLGFIQDGERLRKHLAPAIVTR